MSKPFKMLGHELPGPNQRAPLKNVKQDIINTMKHSSDLMGSSSQIASAYGLDQDSLFAGNPVVEGQDTFTGETTGVKDEIIQQQQSASEGLGKISDDTAKKKVDVEVTVNGQQV